MKQAVILIHGIGEQKPMDTLRAFVAGVLGSPVNGRERFWSKPDPLSDLFELRRLQSQGRGSRTHFYEYYWAYQVEGTSLVDVGLWLWSLIRRRARDMPASAQTMVWAARLSLAGCLVLLLSGVAASWFDSWRSLPLADWRWLLGAGLWFALQAALVHYVGDAARYLSPRPKNIRLRRAIRADGVRLIAELHARGEYERVIVVGHSLGSVIGYDIINAYWQACHDRLPGLALEPVQRMVRESMLAKGPGPQAELRDKLSILGEALDKNSGDAALRGFQSSQHLAQLELRRLGHPWRVSDFITLGSPLAHAVLLLARSSAEFEARKRQRELTTCPPQRDEKGYAYGAPAAVDVGDGKHYTPLLPHHAAPFAITRWTNLYVPVRGGLWGDLVGGPLAEVLGHGIKDVEVRVPGWARWSLLAHTRYWRPAGRQHAGRQATCPLRRFLLRCLQRALKHRPNRPLALDALRAALALGELRQWSRASKAPAKAPTSPATPAYPAPCPPPGPAPGSSSAAA